MPWLPELFSAPAVERLRERWRQEELLTVPSSTTSSDGARRSCRRRAGVAVYVRGESGELAAARIYDDVDPPLR